MGVLRRISSVRVAGEHAVEYVEIVRASGYDEPERESPHAIVTLRHELMATRRTALAALALVGTCFSGLVIGLCVAAMGEASVVVAAVALVLFGVVPLVPSVVLGLHVLRDGRRVKRAHQAWARTQRRLHGRSPHVGALGAPHLFSAAGGMHATTMGVFLVASVIGCWLPLAAGTDDSLSVSTRVGFAIALGIGGAAFTLATYALWHTPWSMFYQDHVV
ncbi:hypothetical protein [Nocardioides lijunqiniae]|uniref:hypothetical protein n=1 Tax=Nocardioides lijunqiniae TaxID=2760832 RepID=UPI001878DAC9|nr:hypothetical protein [Nocardioides lijunqiniae]